MKDSHGRVIDYLRISLTDRCNFRCIYCMPEEGVSQLKHDEVLSIEEIERLVEIAATKGIKHVRLTGGEPLVHKGLVSLVKYLHEIPGIEKIALTTNGSLLSQMAPKLKEAGLSRVNISLDTLDPEQFKTITRRGNLDDVLEGIDAALEVGFNPVKINAVAVRSLKQDFLEYAKLSIERPLHVRFIEYMPVGTSSGCDGSGWGVEDVISTEEIFDIVNRRAEEEGMSPLVSLGKHGPEGWGPARYYKFEGALGTVGFISPLSRHFCSLCNRLRLTADGKLRPCLFSDEEFDIRKALRAGDEEEVSRIFDEALWAKPDEHHHKIGTDRGMSQIGG